VIKKVKKNIKSYYEDTCLWWSAKKIPDRKDSHTAREVIDVAYDFKGLGAYRSIEPSPSYPSDRVNENKSEYASLAKIVKKNKPKNILEIGTARGGSLFLWSRFLGSTERIVCIDLGYHIDRFEARTRLFKQFSDVSMNFIIGDSHKKRTLEEVEAAFGDQPVDFLFIDGDHSYEGVKSDFQTYKKLVKDGGLVAFHDILNEDWPGVGKFWREIKSKYENIEIIDSPERIGIGVLKL